jgi:hypothetical protein
MTTIIQTPTNHLENSIDFYKRLDFKKISDCPVLLSDGKVVVEINNENTARAGVKLIAVKLRFNWLKIRDLGYLFFVLFRQKETPGEKEFE